MFILVVGFVEAMLCIPSTVQSYIVHHWPVLCTMVHKGDFFLEVGVTPTRTNIQFGGAQCSFVLIRWCTWQFVMYVIHYHLDRAHCDVVSLDALATLFVMNSWSAPVVKPFIHVWRWSTDLKSCFADEYTFLSGSLHFLQLAHHETERHEDTGKTLFSRPGL